MHLSSIYDCLRKFFIVFLLCVLSRASSAQQSSRPVVVYVFDAMCGWCYGFNDIMLQIEKNYSNKVDFKVLSAGYAANENAGTISKVLPYLVNGDSLVVQKTGKQFGEKFKNGLLKDDSTIINSRNAAVALYIFSMYQPHKAIAFAECLQQSVFYDGIYPEDEALFSICAMQFDMKPEDLQKRMIQDVYIKAAEAEFIIAEDIDADILPAVYLQIDGEIILLAKGYTDYNTLSKTIDKNLNSRAIRNQDLYQSD